MPAREVTVASHPPSLVAGELQVSSCTYRDLPMSLFFVQHLSMSSMYEVDSKWTTDRQLEKDIRRTDILHIHASSLCTIAMHLCISICLSV